MKLEKKNEIEEAKWKGENEPAEEEREVKNKKKD